MHKMKKKMEKICIKVTEITIAMIMITTIIHTHKYINKLQMICACVLLLVRYYFPPNPIIFNLVEKRQRRFAYVFKGDHCIL